MSLEFFRCVGKGLATKAARILLQVHVDLHVTVDQEGGRERLKADLAAGKKNAIKYLLVHDIYIKSANEKENFKI